MTRSERSVVVCEFIKRFDVPPRRPDDISEAAWHYSIRVVLHSLACWALSDKPDYGIDDDIYYSEVEGLARSYDEANKRKQA